VSQYGQLPMTFVQNDGQTDPSVRYFSQGAGYTLFLTNSGAVLNLSSSGQATALRFSLVGASANPTVIGLGKLQATRNYLIGNDPSQWHTNVANYSSVQYQNIYKGINVVYYGSQGHIEYDFTVAAGVSPSKIRLQINGAQSLSLDAQGN